MSFNSLSYALFLPIVFCLYWLIPAKYRWILMLGASYYFYACWNPKYLGLIIFTTLVSYCAGVAIEKYDNECYGRRRKLVLTLAIVICLGVLFVFKYYNFFAESLVELLSSFSVQISPILTNLILPVGISFYTFQTMSYVIDVYRGDMKAEKHLGYYATYVAFFPQLVAGPIERAVDLLPQIKKPRDLDYEFATYGLKLMSWGYFKKIVIADTLAVYTKAVFINPYAYQGLSLIFVSLCFTIEIYCDFSGYSDIAIGTARLFGIKLMDNFKSPYFSASMKELWRRWHISLLTWMRDYVYIPLGGSKVGPIQRRVNLFLTNLFSGLWHGANWTYIIWGGVHGLVQIVESMLPMKKFERYRGYRLCGMVITFLIWSTATTIFASNSISDALYIITHYFYGISSPVDYIKSGMQTNLSWENIRCLIVSLCMLTAYDYVSLKKDVIASVSGLRKPVRWTIYILFVVWLVMNVSLVDNSQFIYFQF